MAEFILETSYPSRRVIRPTDNSSEYRSEAEIVYTENWKDLFQPQSVNSALQAKVWFSPTWSHLSTI